MQYFIIIETISPNTHSLKHTYILRSINGVLSVFVHFYTHTSHIQAIGTYKWIIYTYIVTYIFLSSSRFFLLPVCVCVWMCVCVCCRYIRKNFYNRIKPQIHFECFIHNLQIIFYLPSVFIVIVVFLRLSPLFFILVLASKEK